MSMFVVKLSGSIATIIGGRVSFGPPVGVIVEAHFVNSAAMKSSTIPTDSVVVMLFFICLLLILLFCCRLVGRLVGLVGGLVGRLLYLLVLDGCKRLARLIGEGVCYSPAVSISRLTPGVEV